jgi:O-antigen/teichoic acid export membrane protein
MPIAVAKNAAFMTAASVGQKVISFAYFSIVARSLGVEGVGKYFFALSFTTVFVVFVDLGFTQALIREAAKAKERLQEYVESVLSVKIITGLFTYAAAVLVINLLGYPEETRHLVYLSGVTMLFDSLHLTLYGAMRSVGDLRFEAGSIIGAQLTTMILGSIFLYFKLPIIFLMLAFAIPSFLNVCFIGGVLKRVHGIRFLPRAHAGMIRFFAPIAAPFAVASIFARVYSYADSILLSRLLGDAAVGWYSIPYKITYAFQFIPLALIAAVYPRFSEYFARDRLALGALFEKSITYLLLAVAPIAVGITLLAYDIILAVYSAEYLPSVLPLKILIVSLVWSFVSFPVGALLNACDRQKTQTGIVGFVMAANIAANLLLIPRFGVVGAALAAAGGNILLTFFGFLVVPYIVPIAYRRLFIAIFRIAIAAACMGGIVWFTNQFSHFTIAIAAGAVVYPAALLATKAVTMRDISDTIRRVRYS